MRRKLSITNQREQATPGVDPRDKLWNRLVHTTQCIHIISAVTDDPELQAMSGISAALAPLDEAAAGRVLRWASDRYGGGLGLARSNVNREQDRRQYAQEVDGGNGNAGSEGRRIFVDVADLYDAASPKTEADKALVTAYWFQVVRGQADLGSQEVNTALKNLGHGVENITKAMTQLMNRTPRQVMQVQKSGKSQQARKRYKLTREGILAVERMTATRSED